MLWKEEGKIKPKEAKKLKRVLNIVENQNRLMHQHIVSVMVQMQN